VTRSFTHFNPLSHIIRVFKLSSITWVMHIIQRFGKKEAEGKSLFKRSRSKLNYNIKINLKEIEEELNITPGLDKIQDYRRNCIQRVKRMPRNR
jgi:hypothetical protein